MKFEEKVLYDKWSTGDKLIVDGTKYRVGKMSYGDYFLEPGKDKGELAPFNSGTLWLVFNREKRIYEVEGS